MRYVIGCDVGSQSLKAVLWREDGEILGTDGEEYPILYPRPTWSEQDTAYWWPALVKTIPRLYRRQGISPQDIVAIGIDATVDSFVPVAEDGDPLYPLLMWMDRRAVEESAEIARRIDPKRLFRITGLNPDSAHTGPKMVWLHNHKPDIYARTWKLMPATTYVVYLLTGEVVVDYSNASSTMVFDVHKRDWSAEMLDVLEIDRERLPEIRRSTDVAGTLKPEVAAELGLSPETQVVVGCGDEHASCVGAGVMQPGVVCDIIGTAEPVCISADEVLFDDTQLVETHCHGHPDRWLLENPGFVSGGNYRWLRDMFYGSDDEDVMSYELLNSEAKQAPPGSEGLLFMPFTMGAMAPEWNAKARGVFYGLTLAHTRSHLARSVLEGSVFALRSVVESMQRTGLEVTEIRAVAGGSRSELVRQIRADALGLPVTALSTSETTVVGAALLAAVGAGLFDDLQQAADLTTKVVTTTEPNLAHRSAYDASYQHFHSVYRSLKDSFEEAAQLFPTAK